MTDKKNEAEIKTNVRETPVGIRDFHSGDIAENFSVGTANLFTLRRKALPIIFVPGIMATRLARGDNRVWDPDHIFWAAKTFIPMSARKRYDVLGKDIEELRPIYKDYDHNQKYFMEVYEDDREKAGTHYKENVYPHAMKRGWVAPYYGSYGALLKALDDGLEPLKFLLDLPVYAFGYNWMQSNYTSGELLAEFIKKVKAHHNAEHVIMITHSMGGFVTRSAMKQHSAEDDVWGAVHTAQPTTGSLDVYRRFIAGEDADVGFPSTLVIGPSGAKITAVLAHSLGGLQLLAGPDYKTVKNPGPGDGQWLHLVTVEESENKKSVGQTWYDYYPKEGECPYDTIYKDKDHYWRLIHEEWLQFSEGTREKQRERIFKFIAEARQFYNDICGPEPYCHPRTIQLYSDAHPTFCEIVWYTEEVTSRFDSIPAYALTKLVRPEALPPGSLTDIVIDRALRAILDLLLSIPYTKPDAFLPGRYVEFAYAAAGCLPGKYGVSLGEVRKEPYKHISDMIDHARAGGRIFVRRLLRRKTKLSEVRKDEVRRKIYCGDFKWQTGEKPMHFYPTINDLPRNTKGDGTVADTASTAITPGMEGWGGSAVTEKLKSKHSGKFATLRSSRDTHAGFFNSGAISPSVRAVYDLALNWLEEHAETLEAGEPFGCGMKCADPKDPIIYPKEKE